MSIKKNTIVFLLVLVVCTQQSYAQWSCCDTISFEKPATNIVIDPLPGNLWQIGNPHKTIFKSSHSGAIAILTDTINTYPQNDTSSFIYIIRNPYTKTCNTCMEFWHMYDMDTLADKGIIDASYDRGHSWVLVNDTNNFSYSFYWSSDYHKSKDYYSQHKLITSGQSDGWIKSAFCWTWQMIVKRADTIIRNPDSLMIRFTFISDSIIKNKDGWMIDDIIVNGTYPGSCSGINEIPKANHISAFPNPLIRQSTLSTDIFLNNAKLAIYNSMGQQIKQINGITGQTFTLRRDNLTSGLYYLILIQDNQTIATGKLIITDN